jgi:hypothetical protein
MQLTATTVVEAMAVMVKELCCITVRHTDFLLVRKAEMGFTDRHMVDSSTVVRLVDGDSRTASV